MVIAQILNLKIFLTLMITINPLSILAPYTFLTESYSEKERRKILINALIFSFLILLGTILAGNAILSVLGLSTQSLQIAGGILFFKFGYETINGQEQKDDVEDSPSLVPLGFPIIAGPGSITALILFTSLSSESGVDKISLGVFFAIFLNLSITYVVLRYSQIIEKIFGKSVTRAMLKITGLLVMSIGIQFIVTGLSL